MSYKVLGQSAPTPANTETDLYTVPASRQTVASSLTVCNRGTLDATFRMAVRPGGAALAIRHYIYYDVTVQAGATFVWTGGITLAATDVVTVRASTVDFSFSLFGNEGTV